MAAPSQQIGRHVVVRRLGSGGMGSLYLARDPAIDRLVAIKLLREDFDSPDSRERFAREARAAGRLRHPNIVTIFDVGEYNGQPFIAMEYISGETVAEQIRRGAPLSLGRKLELMDELCDGLAYAHRAGVIHRDIKPANLMIDQEGILKILDFGIARAGGSAMTQVGTLLGTLSYMAPEQLLGQPVDHRSDIFSVGAVFYELLSRRRAFPGDLQSGLLQRILQSTPEPLESLCPDLDPAIIRVVNRALEKEPDRRYPDLEAMRKDVARIGARLELEEQETTTLDASAAAGTSPAPAPKTPRRGTEREELSKLRARQIALHVETAHQAFQSGDYELAYAACQQALVIDPDHERALAVLDQVRAAMDARQVELWLGEAREHLDRGALTVASELVNRALTLNSTAENAALMRQVVDEALGKRQRARERAQAIELGLERARAALADQAFVAAVAAADDALALDPGHTEAQALKSRALEAVEERRRREEERRALEAVEEARRLFAAGQHQAARAALEMFQPRLEVVAAALSELERNLAEIERRRREEEEGRRREGEERPQREQDERRIAHQKWLEERFAMARTALREQRIEHALVVLQEVQRRDPQAEGLGRLLRQAREAQAAAEEAARVRREIQERLAEASTRFASGDLASALEAVYGALGLDAQHSAAWELHARITQALAERATAETRKRAAAEEATVLAEATRIAAVEPQEYVAEAPAPKGPTFMAETVAIPKVDRVAPTISIEPPRPVPAVPQPAPETIRPTAPPALWARMRRSRVSLGAMAAAVLMVSTWVVVQWWAADRTTAPPAVQSGVLVIQIAPWARVDSIIRRADGKQLGEQGVVTPVVVSLPPGEYAVRASNPFFSQPIELNVTVVAGQVQEVRASMPDFRPDEEVTRMLDEAR